MMGKFDHFCLSDWLVSSSELGSSEFNDAQMKKKATENRRKKNNTVLPFPHIIYILMMVVLIVGTISL